MVGYGDIAPARLEAARGPPSTSSRCGRRYGFDLDRPETLTLAGAEAVLHCAPPLREGERDTRTANLLAALEKARILPTRMVYVSTSGVYGDCGGARVDEDRPVAPQNAARQRRADAERSIAQWCAGHGARLVILRAPGIYAADRLPLERLRAGTPALRAEDDVYTNHIHADDLAAVGGARPRRRSSGRHLQRFGRLGAENGRMVRPGRRRARACRVRRASRARRSRRVFLRSCLPS